MKESTSTRTHLSVLLLALIFGTNCALAFQNPATNQARAEQTVPPMTTIGQLATKEGMHPDYYDDRTHLYNLNKDIPRDFPIPADSHQLEAGNAFPFATVSGPTPQETESFYLIIFQLQGWGIRKHLKFGGGGFTEFIACKGNECVNLSCGTSEWVGKDDENKIKFHFGKDDGPKPGK